LTADESQAAAIPVFDETLRVDKTVAEADRVFIRTSVLERTEYADLELHSGEAIIEQDIRQPVRLRSEEVVSLERHPPLNPTTSHRKRTE
jgi:hypothetical protein